MISISIKRTAIATTMLTLFGLPLTGSAASFDCARASSKLEKTICANAELSQLDTQIGDAYAKLLAEAGPHYQSQIRDVQRSWLKVRPSTADTLKPLMVNRLADLKNAVVTVNSLSFLRINGKVLPPYLLTSLPGSAAYNQWVDQILAATKSEEGADLEMAKCDQQFNNADASPKKAQSAAITQRKMKECEEVSTTSRFYNVDFASSDLLSIEEQISEYSWRAAHPSNSSSHFNWWLSKPGNVKTEEIFIAPQYSKVIQAAARKYRTDLGFDPKVPTSTDITAPALDPKQWGLAPDHLIITGEGYDYELGRGSVEIDIPWLDFGKAMNPRLLGLLKKAKPITDTRLGNDQNAQK